MVRDANNCDIETNLAGIADYAEVPVIILIDWDDDKVLLEDIDLPRPSFHSIMSKISR